MMHRDGHYITTQESGQRLRSVAEAVFSAIYSRKLIKKAISDGRLWVNGEITNSGYLVQPGDWIELGVILPRAPKPFTTEIEVLFESDQVACVVKPAGMATSGNRFKTLQNAILGHLRSSESTDALPWPQPVHRLDSPTSGVVIVAKTLSARTQLFKQFEDRSIEKKYLAICRGFITAAGTMCEPLLGQRATTHWHVIRRVPSLKFGYVSFLNVTLETGRTHQIRKHLVLLGHTIVGDPLYGHLIKYPGKGLFLHAHSITFNMAGKTHFIEAPLPKKFSRFLKNEQRQWEKIAHIGH